MGTTRPPVGLQTIVFGKQYRITDPAVMDHVAQCGYEAVECAANDPAALKRMLDERGLRYGGLHVTVAKLEDPSPIIDTLGELDAHDVCNSGLYTWENPGTDDYKRAIDTFNAAGRRLREAGIHLHYHNHAFEFEMVDGERTGMDLLLEGLDPDAADLCVDVGWVTKAGLDPVAFLREHNAMAGYLHLKDFKGDDWAELGDGEVNIKGVVELLPELTAVRWVMVEQDSTQIDPLESVAISRRYLKEQCKY
ncbi:MAG: TIM barrel protein [Chitinivibrionales bacterium]|nr:TIM barrel protein [Chitinivibrionales bacterium]